MTELRYGGPSPTQATEQIMAWQRAIVAFAPSYAKRPDGSPLRADGWIGDDDNAVAKEYRKRRSLSNPAPGVVVTHEEYGALVKQPPKPRARHLGLAFRGTGGIIGEDYVSRVFQGAADLVEERNPDFPATMGGIPVAAANNPHAVSAIKAAEIGFRSGIVEVQAALKVNPKRKVIIGGYSWGAYVGALMRQWMFDNHPDNYLCSFSIGDPTRPFGGSYYLGPVLAGQGISDWRYGDPRDWRHCWLAHPGDMYTNVPLGVTGDIMDDAFRMVVSTQFSDPIGTAAAILPKIPEVMAKAGIPVTGMFGALAGGIPGAIAFALPLLLSALPGLIAGAGGNVNNLTGPAAAAQAAVIALRFAAGPPPTRDHISYQFDEVWPGQTYIGLARQHVRDWASRVPAA